MQNKMVKWSKWAFCPDCGEQIYFARNVGLERPEFAVAECPACAQQFVAHVELQVTVTVRRVGEEVDLPEPAYGQPVERRRVQTLAGEVEVDD